MAAIEMTTVVCASDAREAVVEAASLAAVRASEQGVPVMLLAADGRAIATRVLLEHVGWCWARPDNDCETHPRFHEWGVLITDQDDTF